MIEALLESWYPPEQRGEGKLYVQCIDGDVLWDASVPRFRETGQNYREWAEEDPHRAYLALRRVITDKLYNGNMAKAAEQGFPERFDFPTTVSIRVHRLTILEYLTGAPPDPKRSKEVARFRFGPAA